MIDITSTSQDTCTVFQLSGEPDKRDVDTTVKKITSDPNFSPLNFVLDIGALKKYPSCLVVMLLYLKNCLPDEKQKLPLLNTPSDFRFILQVAKLDHLFDFLSSIENLQKRKQSAAPPILNSSQKTGKPIIYETELPGLL